MLSANTVYFLPSAINNLLLLSLLLDPKAKQNSFILLTTPSLKHSIFPGTPQMLNKYLLFK